MHIHMRNYTVSGTLSLYFSMSLHILPYSVYVAAKARQRQCGCAGSPEPRLLADATRDNIAHADLLSYLTGYFLDNFSF